MAIKKWLGGTGGSETDVNTAANYSPSGVPVNGDDLFVEANPSGTDYDMAASLSSLSGVTLASLNISQDYSKNVGTTAAYLQVGATTINIGYQFAGSPGQGSNLIRINTGSVQTTVNVFNSSQNSGLANAGPICWLGTHASNKLNLDGGTISVAADPLEVATLLTVNTGGNLSMGAGVTLTTVNVTGGLCLVRSAATTVTVDAGQLTTAGTGAITTVNLNAGTGIFNSTGTITTLNVGAAAADFTHDPRTKTITNSTGGAGGSLNLNNGVKNSITLTNPLATTCNPGQFSFTAWPNSSFQVS